MTQESFDFQLRVAQQRDAAEVLRIWQEAGLRPTPTDSEDALRARAAREDDMFILAEHDGQIIGTVIGGWDGWRGNIYRLAVLPAFQRRGVARALVQSVEAEMKQHGVTRIHVLLKQHATSGQAMDFWKSMGYDLDEESAPLGRNI